MNTIDASHTAAKTINKVSYALAKPCENSARTALILDNTPPITRKVSQDRVIIEQPLKINLAWQEQGKIKNTVFTITMRTPGHDNLLIVGLLFSEGVINDTDDLESIKNISEELNSEGVNNEWLVQCNYGFIPDLANLERFMISYSSCGLCGSTSLKKLRLKTKVNLTSKFHKNSLSVHSLFGLPKLMRQHQVLFDNTGGVHSAALFNDLLALQFVYEDIGRHNAVDKVTGALLTLTEPIRAEALHILVVSSRISFEIVQKTVMAGIQVLAGVGAPSDLAIKAAQQFDLTLIGFLNEQGCNVYHGDWRLNSDG
jgi:FdhD protein